MDYFTFPGGNVLSQFIQFTRKLPFEFVQYDKEYLYGGTWLKLNGSPISSCEPENCGIMEKKCKHLEDSASQYANILENILGQVNNIMYRRSHWIIWFKPNSFDFPSEKL